ncbi:MAG: methyl-accepting chemotaxis protein [Lachnotalea sp.]
MNKKIGVKIGSMLAVLVVICIVSNIVSILSIKNMNSASKDLSEKYIVGVSYLGHIGINIQKEEKFAILLTKEAEPETYDAVTGELAQIRKEIQDQFAEIEIINNELNDPTLIQAFSDFKTAYAEFESTTDNNITLFAQGKKQLVLAADASMLAINENMEMTLKAADDQFDVLTTQAKLEQTNRFQFGVTTITIMTEVGIVVAILIIVMTMISIVNPAKLAKKEIEKVVNDINDNQGDLTKRIKIKTKDEIAQIIKGVNNLIECLQVILKSIKHESDDLQESILQIEQKVAESDSNINEVSSTTQELAASMQEVTSTIIQLNEGASSILEATEVMNERAIEGSEMAKGIKKSAEEMNSSAEQSKNLTDKTVNKIYAELQGALESSKSVYKINELTGQILDISSQTNLLALNASIEAARAGEAGKGFAVVAEEIRVLADNSRDTANNIQEISKMVISAVDQLTKNSESMIEFVSINVLSDYEDFVKSTQEYKRDADNINSIINEFAISSGELKKTMQAMSDGLDGIEVTVDESTQGVTSVANNANGLVEAMSTILSQLENNKKIADKLRHETLKFTSI